MSPDMLQRVLDQCRALTTQRGATQAEQDNAALKLGRLIQDNPLISLGVVETRTPNWKRPPPQDSPEAQARRREEAETQRAWEQFHREKAKEDLKSYAQEQEARYPRDGGWRGSTGQSYAHTRTQVWDECLIIILTPKAVLLAVDGVERWVPKSLLINAFSEWAVGDLVRVEVPLWFTHKEGWERPPAPDFRPDQDPWGQ